MTQGSTGPDVVDVLSEDHGEASVKHDKEEHEESVRVMKDLERADTSDAEFLRLVEAAHKLVGPGVSVVDRLRDKLTGRSTA